MTLLISHRGNTNGIDLIRENSPEYVQEALEKGYHVVVDVWIIGRTNLALGTEHALFPVSLEFLKNKKIICRAKSAETLEYLLINKTHCFMHERDDHVLTNGGLIWTFPGKPIMSRSILTMPEYIMSDITSFAFLSCAGVCSSRIQEIKDYLDSLDK